LSAGLDLREIDVAKALDVALVRRAACGEARECHERGASRVERARAEHLGGGDIPESQIRGPNSTEFDDELLAPRDASSPRGASSIERRARVPD
jgi:hypothetical protein